MYPRRGGAGPAPRLSCRRAPRPPLSSRIEASTPTRLSSRAPRRHCDPPLCSSRRAALPRASSSVDEFFANELSARFGTRTEFTGRQSPSDANRGASARRSDCDHEYSTVLEGPIEFRVTADHSNWQRHAISESCNVSGNMKNQVVAFLRRLDAAIRKSVQRPGFREGSESDRDEARDDQTQNHRGHAGL